MVVKTITNIICVGYLSHNENSKSVAQLKAIAFSQPRFNNYGLCELDFIGQCFAKNPFPKKCLYET